MSHRVKWVGLSLLALASSASWAATPTNKVASKAVSAKQLQDLQTAIDRLQQELNQAKAAAAEAKVEAKTASEQSAAAVSASEGVARSEDLDGLRGDLENYKYEQTRNRETKTALTVRGTSIGGSIQARATYESQGNKTGTTSIADERHSSFDVPLATINFAGSLYRDYAEGRNLDYRLAFAYAKTSPATNNSNFNLTDAFLRYSPVPTLTGLEDPKLTLTLGQQQIPFGLEAQVGEELRPTILQAQFLGTTGVGSRQIGLILRGDYDPYVDYGFNYRAPLLEYNLGIVNGNGPNKSDDNSDKDWVARLAYTLPVDYTSLFRELKIGLSYYRGQKNLSYTPDSTSSTSYKPLTVTLPDGSTSNYLDKVVTTTTYATEVTQGHSDRYGFDLYYNHDPFGFTYEFIEGRDQKLKAKSLLIADEDVRSRGQYLTLFYTWGEQWVKSFKGQAKYDDWWPKSYQAFLRADEWDPDTKAEQDEQRIWTGGINVFFAETTKLQFNLNHYDYERPTTRSKNEYLAQFQFGF